MGKVCLLSNHNFLREEVIFSPETFKGHCFEEAGKEVPQIFYNALTAMSNLQNFDFDCWLFEDPRQEILEPLIRPSFCRVIFNKDIVVDNFSFSGEKDPFYVLFGIPHISEDDYVQSIKEWTIKQWEKFLIQSIKNELQKDIYYSETRLKEKKHRLEEYQKTYQEAEENFIIQLAFEESVIKALDN